MKAHVAMLPPAQKPNFRRGNCCECCFCSDCCACACPCWSCCGFRPGPVARGIICTYLSIGKYCVSFFLGGGPGALGSGCSRVARFCSSLTSGATAHLRCQRAQWGVLAAPNFDVKWGDQKSMGIGVQSLVVGSRPHWGYRPPHPETISPCG